ncbi:MAG: TonB-dependent receptor [Terracidiphilus sp.]
MLRRICRTLGFLAALNLSVIASAQTAQLSGRVTDPTQAVVANADVRIVNQATSIKTTAKTNGDGLYAIPFVEPGTYKIFVEAQGFSTAASQPVTVSVGQAFVYDVQLKVGNAEQQVTVNAANADVNTTDASVSTVVDRQSVENLPLNGRSFQSLLYMTPGVNLNTGSGSTGTVEGTAGQFVVNGQRADASYWMVDGVGANVGMASVQPGTGAAGTVGATNAVGGTDALVAVDALQEFRFGSSTYAPEFGRLMGGQIEIQTRSGANQFHGLLFEYLRNTVFDAANWFNDNQGLPKAGEIQNDFGGVVGGPILKDKAFFFFSYEGLRLIQPFTFEGTVPDANARTSAIPAMQPYVNMFPQPAAGAVDTAPGSGIVDYTTSFSNPSRANAYSLRIDDHLGSKWNVFARYDHAPSSFTLRGDAQPANDITNESAITKTATAGATWIASPRVVDDLRFNYSVSGSKSTYITDSYGGGTPMPDAGFFPSGYNYGNSLYAFEMLFGSNMTDFEGLGGANYQRQYNVVESLSVQKGAHALKFGVDYRALSPNYGQAPYEAIPFFYGMSAMEMGDSPLFVASNYAGGSFLMQNLGMYGQDTWRVNSRLNLTYGLRWDVDIVPKTTNGGVPLPGLTGFSTNPADLSNLGQAPGTPPYHTNLTGLEPRFGGAYRLRTSPNWGLVLRGGLGLFDGLTSTETVNAYAIEGPDYPYGTDAFEYNVAFPITPAEGVRPTIAAPNNVNNDQLFGIDPNLGQPRALEWNLALEQSLGSAQTVSLTYIGARDTNLLGMETGGNFPTPNYYAVYIVDSAGSSNYQGLQAQYQRRLSHGLQALIYYAWSHSIDDGSYGNYPNDSVLSPPSASRGNSDFDLRNVFSAAVTFQPPALKNNLLLRAITSNWSTDDIVTLRSGAPVDLTDEVLFDNNDYDTLNETIIRPDRVSGQPLYLHGSQYAGGVALNPAAFTDPPSVLDPSLGVNLPTRNGDLGRNRLRALGLKQWDFSAHRDFPIHENLKLQFRGELFNCLNHPNFGPFNNQYATAGVNPYFGQITGTLNQYLGSQESAGGQGALYAPGGPRAGEFALKLMF